MGSIRSEMESGGDYKWHRSKKALAQGHFQPCFWNPSSDLNIQPIEVKWDSNSSQRDYLSDLMRNFTVRLILRKLWPENYIRIFKAKVSYFFDAFQIRPKKEVNGKRSPDIIIQPLFDFSTDYAFSHSLVGVSLKKL